MTSIGSAKWKQSGEENNALLEITVPLVLPANVRPKDLQVITKDEGEIICIKLKEATLLQWRLYSRVLPEVEWDTTDGGASITLELQKKDASSWPCLLNVPMKPTDKIFLTESELDALFAKEIKPLPPVEKKVQPTEQVSDAAQQAPAGETKESEKNAPEDVDLDALLDQAAAEIVQEKSTKSSSAAAAGDSSADLDIYVRAELKGLEDEEKEIVAKQRELEELAADASKEEDVRRSAERQIKIVERLLELHGMLRQHRTLPSTLRNFLLVQEIDLLKSRCNIGETTEAEIEAFASDEERELTPHELMSIGIHHLQQQDLAPALHFLRLAAINHKHPTSTTILLRLYSELGSPRGMFLLFKRAMMDTPDLDPQTNLQAAELVDKGARHFPSIFPAAVFYYQRAALAGNVHAMMALAQLFLRGATSATTVTEAQRKENINLEKYHAWLELALDRGASSAYFVKGCMHLRGEHGLPQSYADAKKYLELAMLSQPDLIRRAPNIPSALEKLRIEEEARVGATGSFDGPASPPSPAPSPTSSAEVAPPVAAPKAALKPAAVAPTANDRIAKRMVQFDQETVELPRVADKKATLSTKKAAGGNNVSSGVASRLFWERVGTTGFTLYATYFLMFPIRIMMLPHFYTVVGNLIDRFGGVFGGSSRSGLL
jgi:hypothetical protein